MQVVSQVFRADSVVCMVSFIALDMKLAGGVLRKSMDSQLKEPALNDSDNIGQNTMLSKLV